MTIPESAIVAIERKTGKIVPYRTYTKTERMIRWIGRTVHIQSIAQYHTMTLIGVRLNGHILVRGLTNRSE